MGTTIRNKERNITDVNLTFTPNPNTGDILKLKNTTVIRRSIEHILTLGSLEKPFREDMGSEISLLLFEVVGPADIPALESRIENAIDRNEPRVRLLGLDVQANFAAHSVEVTIRYAIRATDENDTFKVMLKLSD